MLDLQEVRETNMKPIFLSILLSFGIVYHASSSVFPVYKHPLTHYEVFEQAILSDNLIEVEKLIPQLSPDDLGTGLVCAVVFHKVDIALSIFKSGRKISDSSLNTIIRLQGAGNEELLNLVAKRLNMHEMPSWFKDPYDFSSLARNCTDYYIMPWIILYLRQHPEEFSTLQISESNLHNLNVFFQLDPSAQNQEIFLASFLAFKYHSKGKALEEFKRLQIEKPDRFRSFDMSLFKENLDAIFSFEPFSHFGARFDEARWAGHKKRERKGDEEFYSLKEKLPQLSESETFKVEVLGQEQTLAYDLFKGTGDPKYIVISVYAGYNKDFPGPHDLSKAIRKPNAELFPDPSIWSISLGLWDYDSPISQANQLLEDNFKETHASYLYATSEFIHHIQKEYPNAKILLYGASFGGFFATSYAFLQSICQNPSFPLYAYNREVAIDFLDLFPDHKIAPIAGFISFAGAIEYMEKIIRDSRSLTYMTVPGFFAYNHDDDRVYVKEIRPVLSKFPRDVVEIYFNREGATDYGKDIKNAHYTPGTTTRGHFSPQPTAYDRTDRHEWVELMEAMIGFMHRLKDGKIASTPTNRVLQDRRFNLHVNDGSLITSRDVQQFLMNAAHRKPRALKAALEPEHINQALDGIRLPLALTILNLAIKDPDTVVQLLEKVQSPKLTVFVNVVKNMKRQSNKCLETFSDVSNKDAFMEALLSHSPNKLDLKTTVIRSLYQATGSISTKGSGEHPWAESDLEALRGKLNTFSIFFSVLREKINALYDTPEFQKFLEGLSQEASLNYIPVLRENQGLVYEDLLQRTTTRGVWGSTIERVRQDVSKRRDIRKRWGDVINGAQALK